MHSDMDTIYAVRTENRSHRICQGMYKSNLAEDLSSHGLRIVDCKKLERFCSFPNLICSPSFASCLLVLVRAIARRFFSGFFASFVPLNSLLSSVIKILEADLSPIQLSFVYSTFLLISV